MATGDTKLRLSMDPGTGPPTPPRAPSPPNTGAGGAPGRAPPGMPQMQAMTAPQAMQAMTAPQTMPVMAQTAPGYGAMLPPGVQPQTVPGTQLQAVPGMMPQTMPGVQPQTIPVLPTQSLPAQQLPPQVMQSQQVPTQGLPELPVMTMREPSQPMAPLPPMYEWGAPAPPVILPPRTDVERLWFGPVPIPVPMPMQGMAMPQYYPTPVTHTFKKVAPHYDHDFPYQDPAFGAGWRFHYPDNLDEALINMGTYKPTPLQEMRHAAYEKQMKEEWLNAHVAESQYGVRHRAVPFSRRVRLPERLIPDPEDYSEIIL